MRDPNRPVPGVSHPDGERYLGNGATGDAARDGYTVVARRPRTAFIRESLPVEEADRIDEMYRRDLPGY